MAEEKAEGFFLRGADGRLYIVRDEHVSAVPQDDMERVRRLFDELVQNPEAAVRIDEDLRSVAMCIKHFQIVDAWWYRKGG